LRLLFLDCSSGIAGDMFLASLLDLGVPLSYVEEGLRSLELSEDWSLELIETRRRGISAKQLLVTVQGQAADEPRHPQEHHHQHDHHGHEHPHDEPRGRHRDPRDHGHHGHHQGAQHHHPHDHDGAPHRPYRAIKELIARSPLPDGARQRALRVFAELARAEGAVHGVDPEDVHFHEVGSTDAIIDIVGVALALEWLGVEAVEASPLHLGSGFVTAQHGRLPVPAPATLRLIQGFPAYQTDIRGELVTPTGAALVRALCRRVGPMPLMQVERVGSGAGSKEFPIPNILRAILGEPIDAGPAPWAGAPDPSQDVGFATDEVVELAANVDDMSPQLLAALIDSLLQAGALDVWVAPVTMKKGRPGHVIHVLAPPDAYRQVAGRLFEESTTLGLRYQVHRRLMLHRAWIDVETPAGPVRVKIGRAAGKVWNIAPEYEDCLKAARASGTPLKRVMAEAQKAAMEKLEATDAP
jgi:TIGR00299 family protein